MKIKIDALMATVICFGMAGFCIWFNYTQVAPHSVKHTLDLCMWASAVLGVFGIGIALSPAWKK